MRDSSQKWRHVFTFSFKHLFLNVRSKYTCHSVASNRPFSGNAVQRLKIMLGMLKWFSLIYNSLLFVAKNYQSVKKSMPVNKSSLPKFYVCKEPQCLYVVYDVEKNIPIIDVHDMWCMIGLLSWCWLRVNVVRKTINAAVSITVWGIRFQFHLAISLSVYYLYK